jgi:molybdenum cofactor biosynthesis enzyme MoaA
MSILTVSINAYCNLACEFCYQKLDGSQLSVVGVLALSHVKPGQNVQIDGGEPMLYPKIVPLVDRLSKDNHVHISTNGTYIPEGFLSLDDAVRKNVELQVSLHASNSRLYAAITGHDLFDTVMNNIDSFRNRYATGLSCAVYDKNFDDIPEIIDLSRKNGLPLRVNLVFPINNTVKLLEPRQVDQLKSYLLSRKISGDNIDSPLLHDNNCHAISKYYGMDKKGVCPVDCNSKIYINPRGEIRSCEFIGE